MENTKHQHRYMIWICLKITGLRKIFPTLTPVFPSRSTFGWPDRGTVVSMCNMKFVCLIMYWIYNAHCNRSHFLSVYLCMQNFMFLQAPRMIYKDILYITKTVFLEKTGELFLFCHLNVFGILMFLAHDNSVHCIWVFLIFSDAGCGTLVWDKGLDYYSRLLMMHTWKTNKDSLPFW